MYISDMTKDFRAELNTRYIIITQSIIELEKKLKEFPEGRLSVKHRKNVCHFYREGLVSGVEYLNKDNSDLIEKLVQKNYLEKVLKAAKQECTALQKALNIYPVTVAEEVYDTLAPDRKALAKPIILSDKEFAKRWLATPYKRKTIKKGITTFKTLKGDKVRSKSEVIIADRLWANGIPYKYECPLIAGGEIIHPDVTILRMSDRKIVYHEHCGRMDDPGYTEDMVNRNNLYAKERIYNGDRLFYSFESSTTPLNTEYIDDFINTNFR